MSEFLPYTLPPNMEITPDEVHVWLVSLQIPSADLHRLINYLSADEEKRKKEPKSSTLKRTNGITTPAAEPCG